MKAADLVFEKELVSDVADIKKAAAYLDFETSGTIRLMPIG